MSYLYVYDKFVQEKKYERDVVRIEQRLADIGIQGKIARLAMFRSAGEVVRDEVKRGAHTVVVVGDDATFHSVMSVVPELPVVVGFLPVGDSCRISEVLGVPKGPEACDILSARLTETLDVGRVNGHYFLTSVQIFHQDAIVDCGPFRVKPALRGGVEVRNLGSLGFEDIGAALANPRDGILDTHLFAELPKEGIFSRPRITQSMFPLKQFTIYSEGEPIKAVIDGVERQFESLRFDVLPKQLKVIVGKGRKIS